ncbi:MAG: hypothetical protein JOZ78_15520 [Chroococcidiopsidaceae cyanobacterium CP_BM_ER_R8_30]|nr:hypothetical protein [Chroococcidiopsidaceae cyanobacterium CP_BM_ER_R8_30]
MSVADSLSAIPERVARAGFPGVKRSRVPTLPLQAETWEESRLNADLFGLLLASLPI